jgi:hypothetical protein
MLARGSRAATVTAVTLRRWRPGAGAVVVTVIKYGDAGSLSVYVPPPSTLIIASGMVGISTPR